MLSRRCGGRAGKMSATGGNHFRKKSRFHHFYSWFQAYKGHESSTDISDGLNPVSLRIAASLRALWGSYGRFLFAPGGFTIAPRADFEVINSVRATLHV